MGKVNPQKAFKADDVCLNATMTPREIVDELDRYIIGQQAAKRAVAIALRNRWRRMQLDDELRREIFPKNILMIGPTGVGKTEIARRLSALAGAPFIKVEATKFTEVGYVGRDVESIIRDLMDTAVKMVREAELVKVRSRAEEIAVETILYSMLRPARDTGGKDVEESVGGETAKTAGTKDDSLAEAPVSQSLTVSAEEQDKSLSTLESLRGSKTWKVFYKKLLNGELDDKEIEVEISATPIGVEIMAPPGMEETISQLQHMFQHLSGTRKKMRKMKVKDALRHLSEDEAARMVNEEEIQQQAITSVEQNGIIFLDEIDKVARRSEHSGGPDVSREGVQRDLLPLVEGCTVFTKYGMLKTDHILFIAAGAFHLAKPSDLVPELQGRLPIRVELAALTTEDFVRILTEPKASLTEQYIALMGTENLTVEFTKEGIKRVAEVAFQVNERTENIGARRLYTVMERLLETLSFEATERNGQTVVIDKDYVNRHLGKLVKDDDLSRYIL